ncbi:unnamed protein product [Soboliphyme baturini]|uniref:Methyltransferase-like protein 5 n=1 Tax=Soboliphyme baturini TaxID=241478 RepID=A0A183IXE8_9BILA|nr:unnamed protein product [Soboliphyme baturini]
MLYFCFSLAAVLLAAHEQFDDIEGQVCADLGCGCGTFAAGLCSLSADYCFGFDIDSYALKICVDNMDNLEIYNADFVQCDVSKVDKRNSPRLENCVDTVFMNPPFGTKGNKGADISFLSAAIYMSRNTVYSLHKSSTRRFILKKAQQWGVEAEVVAELRFDLPAVYKFHKCETQDVQVDFLRFSKIRRSVA